MKLYTAEQTEQLHQQHFAFLIVEEKDHVLTVTLNRPEKKNALHPQMVNELAYAMQYAHDEKNVRVVMLKANGTIFCAGGDLKAMAGIIEPNNSTIPMPQTEVLLGEIFNKVYKPIIAVVAQNVFAGGFLLLGGCQYVVAQEGLKFGLPEVKRGLFPFQVMESMLRIMPARKVMDWCVRGFSVDTNKAYEYGFVTNVTPADELEKTALELADEIKENAPAAVSLGLEAFDHIQSSANNHKYLSEMLQKAILSKDGQEGLKAFREKRKPNWVGE